jgi:hypothetical protein
MKYLTGFILLFLFVQYQIIAQPVSDNTLSSFGLLKITEASKEFEPQNHTIGRSDLITPVMIQNELSYAKETQSSGIVNSIRNKSGLAFLSSAILPGSGQAANKNWVRSGIYLALEGAAIFLVSHNNSKAKSRQRNYENFVDQNWSVVQYAQWIVEFHEVNGLSNEFLADLKSQVDGVNAAFDTSIDWNRVDIRVLNNVERNTPFIFSDMASNNFSHTLPGFGSQQYYELVSKFYQFGPGWRDFNTPVTENIATASAMSNLFFEGRDRAEQFNDNFRRADNIFALLIVNHIVSAFDAFFTVRLRQHRMQAKAGVLPGEQLQITYRF